MNGRVLDLAPFGIEFRRFDRQASLICRCFVDKQVVVTALRPDDHPNQVWQAASDDDGRGEMIASGPLSGLDRVARLGSVPTPQRSFAVNAITPMSKFSACRAPINGLDMYYEISGKGPPAVFIHPFAAYGSVHGDLLPRTIPNRRWITMDIQGHGRTPDVDRPLTYEQEADDVAALLRYLGLEKADVFGESKGGIVAVLLAVRHPELVRRVAIYGSVLGRFEEITRSESRAAFMTLTPEHHSVQFQREKL
jgi:alpha/beta hydrolase fold